nr:glycine cleavage system aminomethyltransferase GcvT [Polyangiaceae bacterium]
TVMCTPDGGIVDDLLVYRLGAEQIFLCVNASTRDKDFEHIIKYASGEAMITHRSEEFMQFAVQGPRAVALLESITSGVDVSSIKYFFAATGEVAGVECLISRTGYTGEDGFEVYVPAAQGAEVFDALVVAGSQFGMLMCGLGCRDTLRLEAKLHGDAAVGGPVEVDVAAVQEDVGRPVDGVARIEGLVKLKAQGPFALRDRDIAHGKSR